VAKFSIYSPFAIFSAACDRAALGRGGLNPRRDGTL